MLPAEGVGFGPCETLRETRGQLEAKTEKEKVSFVYLSSDGDDERGGTTIRRTRDRVAVERLHVVMRDGHLLDELGEVRVRDRVAVPRHAGRRCVQRLDLVRSLERRGILGRVVPLGEKE